VDDAELEHRLIDERHQVVLRMPPRLGHLVGRRQVRARLHLHHRVALAIEHVHVVAVLEERRAHGQRLLVIEDGAVLHERLDVTRDQRVAEHVRVRRVLVVDHLRDHDVADAAVERRGLAHDVDAAQLLDAQRDRCQVMVRRHAERVVDVDDHGTALGEAFDARHVDARIEVLGPQQRELDDLGVDVDLAGRRDRADAARGV
jgi:hypothetical protein